MQTSIDRLKRWARLLRRDIMALWIAARDARTTLGAKLIAGAVAAYALSPIDLIPDFIPVIGYLDDLLIVPLGIALAARLLPPALLAEFRETAAAKSARPSSYVAAGLIGATWLTLVVLSTRWIAAIAS